MTVTTPLLIPPVALDTASDVFSSCGEDKCSLGWTVAVLVDDGTVTVTIPLISPTSFDVASYVELWSG